MTALSRSPARRRDWPTQFEIGTRRDGEIVYVEPAGELDLVTSAALRDQVDALMTAHSQQVIVDLRGLTFIGCAAVRALLALDADTRRQGALLSLLQADDPVRRVFALTATLDALPFTEAPRP
jgi:anti-anti-sigma factor